MYSINKNSLEWSENFHQASSIESYEYFILYKMLYLSKEELKSLLMKVKEESEKPGLKLNNQKLRS